MFVQESKIILIQNDWIGKKGFEDFQTDQYFKVKNTD